MYKRKQHTITLIPARRSVFRVSRTGVYWNQNEDTVNEWKKSIIEFSESVTRGDFLQNLTASIRAGYSEDNAPENMR